MRDDVTLQHHLSLAGSIYKMIPAEQPQFPGCLNEGPISDPGRICYHQATHNFQKIGG